MPLIDVVLLLLFWKSLLLLLLEHQVLLLLLENKSSIEKIKIMVLLMKMQYHCSVNFESVYSLFE
jgi:hypothetical protein